MTKWRVAVVGCGLIGSRRAAVAAADPESAVTIVADVDVERACSLAHQISGAAAVSPEQLDYAAVDVVVVATPNGHAPAFVRAALNAGKHVLMEKPPGRNLAEARMLVELAEGARGKLKVGFNHRYHPALSEAYRLWSGGSLGAPVSGRARYGHGGRPGYENEWRGNPLLAGGGVLLDQGVHIADLLHWFLGMPETAYSLTQSAVWPLNGLEDSAFGLLAYPGRRAASLHVAWTQWKNLFSLELFAAGGSLSIEGLGGSYGAERLTVSRRKPAGGVPDMEELVFEGPDTSWELEWQDFRRGVRGDAYWGTPADGLAAMRILEALYASAKTGSVARV